MPGRRGAMRHAGLAEHQDIYGPQAVEEAEAKRSSPPTPVCPGVAAGGAGGARAAVCS